MATPRSDPRWSVLLPTHNRPSTLALSIRSVLDQSDGDLELLVVGDGCTDDTAQVVASFADSRVRWFDLPKGEGFGYAHRREVLTTATGRYLAPASHDDLWAPNHLARLGELLDRGCTLAYTTPLWVRPSGHIVPVPIDLRDPTARERFELDNHIPSTFWAAPLAAVAAAGGWPVDVASAADWQLMRRLLALDGATVGYSTDATALHFRALSRNGEHRFVEVLFGDPDTERWWPPGARIEPEREELQATVARAASSSGWWERLGQAAGLIQSHLALESIELRMSSAATAHQLAEALSARDAVEATYRQSHSWRLTAPLRWLTERLSAKR